MLKKFLITFYFIIAIFLPVLVMAIEFKPSINIPGSEFTKEVTVDGGTLARYIVGIYRYGGMFAGVVAMFMLVYAGWEWLLAGGNSSKISSARDKINSVLIGLALLFGGYILLSLISENLVKFQSLKVALPDVKEICMAIKKDTECEKAHCVWTPATADELVKDPAVLGHCTDILSLTLNGCIPETLLKDINIPGITIGPKCEDARLTGPTISVLVQAKDRADALGYTLTINGAFRSAAYQQFLYDCYMTVHDGGVCPADCMADSKCNLASKPDCQTSSHMQGIAIDVCGVINGLNTCGHADMAHNCTSENSPSACAGVPGLYKAQIDLKALMEKAGFSKDVSTEWWHFTNRN